MLSYSELIELREEIGSNRTTIDKAKEYYWNNFDKGKRSWHTKDWKARRLKVIKNKCQICNGTETLTIQHLSHPKKYYEHENKITKAYTQKYIETHLSVNRSEFRNHLLNKYDYEPVSLCPKCSSRHTNKRKRKLPQYLCTVCKHEFDMPSFKTVDDLVNMFYTQDNAIELRDKCFVSKNKWSKRCNLSSVKYWFQREKAKSIYSDEIKKKAFLNYLDDTIKYLSFEDTITACKKCAFTFDVNNMELCQKCKKNYKGIEFQTCIECLPTGKRRAARAKIAFGKNMHELHKRLEID